MSSERTVTLSREEAEQLLELLDTGLERGFDAADADEAALESARDKLREGYDLD